jgi:acylphosphatase
MKRYIITVTGKVQGVFYRDTARQVANGLGLAGFARNEPGGAVLIEVEGDEDALQKFLEWCSEGSEYSEVKDIKHTERQPAGHSGFRVE